ncbi:hypothetical protein [Acidovorax sp. FG27]|uniref:hypothetical protein n=1 Tax=Acidovorax sp. FG27 TaxID=3133652 RepID=UPI0030E7ABEC
MTPLISGIASVASLLLNVSKASASASPSADEAAVKETPAPSSRVTLSAQAQQAMLAAGQGVRVDALPSGVSPADARRSVSTADFRELLGQFGATESEQATLAAGFDADKDGSVSADEFLQGLARAGAAADPAAGATTAGPGGEAFTQSLLQLLDRQGQANGVVSQAELAGLTTAFAGVQALRRG